MDNEIRYLLAGLDERLVHGPYGLLVLRHDLLRGATALRTIAAHAANESNVGCGVLTTRKFKKWSAERR